MALTALDASVLIALLDPNDAHHRASRAALEAHADDDLRIAAHTLSEASVHPVRAGKEREARRLIGALEIAVDPVDEPVAVAAARLRAQHGSALRRRRAPARPERAGRAPGSLTRCFFAAGHQQRRRATQARAPGL